MPIERQAPDVIITNATVRTLDTADSVVEAVATKADRIVGLGSNQDVASLTDAQTRLIDAGGRTVLPAFTDTHTHFRRGSLASPRASSSSSSGGSSTTSMPRASRGTPRC